jgi:5-methyltetrahydrofolate--homocysteine methyltransferase
MSILDDIKEEVINGNINGIGEIVQQALDDSVEAETILGEALIPAMATVGENYECGDFFVPEMLVAARAMQAGMNVLKPLLTQAGVEPLGRVAIGTVQGDLHDVGKNLVAMMLEGAGFEVKDLGTEVKPERFVAAVKDGAQLIGMSALLTTTMPSMETTIAALNEAGVRDQVKIMVGGAPVTQDFANSIGADGYAPDASSAANTAKSLLGV